MSYLRLCGRQVLQSVQVVVTWPRQVIVQLAQDLLQPSQRWRRGWLQTLQRTHDLQCML